MSDSPYYSESRSEFSVGVYVDDGFATATFVQGCGESGVPHRVTDTMVTRRDGTEFTPKGQNFTDAVEALIREGVSILENENPEYEED